MKNIKSHFSCYSAMTDISPSSQPHRRNFLSFERLMARTGDLVEIGNLLNYCKNGNALMTISPVSVP
jgi:hypothetical protein